MLIEALMGGQVATSAFNAYNQYQAQKDNLRFQKDNLNYQKSVQQTEWNREDNAVQRRVADFTKAGLSPTLAAGSAAGAGPVVATQAPHKDPVQLDDAASKVMAMISAKQNIAQSNAQIELLNQQKEKASADTRATNLDSSMKQWDFDINKAAGLPNDASSFFKTLRDGASVFLQASKDKAANITNNVRSLKGTPVENKPQQKNIKYPVKG